MKKQIVIWMSILLSILVTGCTNSPYPNEDSYDAQWDYPYMYHDRGHGLKTASTDKGYFFLHESLMYYMDKGSSKPVLVNNRPDQQCKDHSTDAACLTFVKRSDEEAPHFMQYYDDSLYVLEQYMDMESEQYDADTAWTLARLDKNGKSRQEIKSFDTAPTSIAIHRGYLYYSTSEQTTKDMYQVKVFKNKFEEDNTLGSTEAIYTGTNDMREIVDIIPYGNQLYWGVSYTSRTYGVQRFDLSSGEATELWDRGDSRSSLLLTIADDKLFFSYIYKDPVDQRTFKKYSSDLKGNQIEVVMDEQQSVVSALFKDSSYTYDHPVYWKVGNQVEDAPFPLTIYKDDEKVHQVDMSAMPESYGIIVGDDQYMFTHYRSSGKSGILYLDKSQIDAGQAAFKPLLETRYFDPTS